MRMTRSRLPAMPTLPPRPARKRTTRSRSSAMPASPRDQRANARRARNCPHILNKPQLDRPTARTSQPRPGRFRLECQRPHGLAPRRPHPRGPTRHAHLARPYSPRSSPMKKRATVPGPVCEPMTVPMLLITTLPASAGNLASTMSRTASASSRHALIESEHLPA